MRQKAATDNDLGMVLDVVGATLGPMVVLRTIVRDGALVDAEVVWATPALAERQPVIAGERLFDRFGTSLAGRPAELAVRAALRTPGETIVVGPFGSEMLGRTRTYEVSAVATGDLVTVKFHDVTARSSRGHGITASEEQFRRMLDGMDSGVVLLHPILEDGKVVDAELIWANTASTRLWVDPRGSLPGVRVRDAYCDVDEWLQAANEAWAGTTSTRVLENHPSHATWIAATQDLTRLGNSLLEFTHDRSRDHQLVARLAAADRQFAALVNDLPMTVFVGRWGKDELDFISPNATELLGRPLAELRKISDLLGMIVPDDRPTGAAIDGWVTGATDEFMAQWDVRRDDGTEIVISFRAVRREDPEFTDAFVATASDITPLRRQLEEVEAGERLRVLGHTAGSIAHDFNNLLMIVNGNVQQVLGHDPANGKLLAAMSAGERAADLAQSLLAFARGRPGSPGPVDVVALLRQFEPIAYALLPSAAMLNLSMPEQAPLVHADPAHLEQVVLNLVTNARDAIDRYGTVSITLGITDDARCHFHDHGDTGGPYLSICVEDDGAGVDPHTVSRVWEPFFTTKQATKEHGTGLGLSTVDGLAHQYGGHVHLESIEDEGTCVTVFLPVLPAG